MATVADYIKFADQAFDLPEVNGTQNFLINLPNNFNNKISGILTFMLHINNGKSIKLALGMGAANNVSTAKSIGHITLSGDYFGTVQQLLGGAPLVNGNMLYFTRTGGTGTLKVSDVVIWFQVNVE